MEFKDFAEKVNQQIEVMKLGKLFQVKVSKNELFGLYLDSFAEGTNDIHLTNTWHDCYCCKHFIRDVGGMVSIKDGEIVTIWDVEVEAPYKVVAEALSLYVKSLCNIDNLYSNPMKDVGAEVTHSDGDSGVTSYNHFYGIIPEVYTNFTPTHLSEVRSTVKVFRRGMDEITSEALNAVLELMNQGTLYRGDEFRDDLMKFLILRASYKSLDLKHQNIFAWVNYNQRGSRIRNTVIGSLLQDLSEGKDLEGAVKSYEAKTAPLNYKRPKPKITASMVKAATKAVNDGGIQDSLYRRFAVADDISVNDVLFADRSVKQHMKDNIFDSLMAEVKTAPKLFSGVQEFHIDEFIDKVVPRIDAMEMYFDNSHQGNLMSLIGPKHAEAPNLFRWDNPFSWSYNGNVTDSMKQRVKAAGGKVDGFMRASLSWSNEDDLDIHVKEPNGYQIYFGNRLSYNTEGRLDVDMNIGKPYSREAVENITWPIQHKLDRGVYHVRVHNYQQRETIDVGFEIEIDCDGKLYNFVYDKPVGHQKFIDVARIGYDGNKFEVQRSPDVQEGQSQHEAWGIKTNVFHKVTLMTLSPNHWHGSAHGLRHYMFTLDGCKNDEQPRGFYNEFLPSKYSAYRKTFEVLADKTKCEMSDNQLSGLGFSSTTRAEIICKVSGEMNGTLKIKF